MCNMFFFSRFPLFFILTRLNEMRYNVEECANYIIVKSFPTSFV
jgi:hypothetical protein